MDYLFLLWYKPRSSSCTYFMHYSQVLLNKVTVQKARYAQKADLDSSDAYASPSPIETARWRVPDLDPSRIYQTTSGLGLV